MLDMLTIASFVKVIEKGSFSAAAYELSMTPSSISKQISRLEKDVGAQLINRSTHKLCLTEAGTVFLERARKLMWELEDIRDSVHEAHDTIVGTMNIHMTPGTGQRVVLPLILEFMEMHPGLAINFIVRGELPDMPHDGYDLSFSSGPAHDGKVRPSGISGEKLTTARYRICGSPKYFEHAGLPAHPKDLARHNCLIYSNQPGTHDWWFKGPDGPYSVRVNGRLAADDWSVLYLAAVAGLGIARLLDADVAAAVNEQRLQPIFTELAVVDREVWVFCPRTDPTPRKTRVLLDFLRSRLV